MITNELRPVMKENGFLQGRKNHFIKEENGLVYAIILYFTRTEIRFVSPINVLFEPMIGGICDGLPNEVLNSPLAKDIFAHPPVAFSGQKEYFSQNDPQMAEILKENAQIRFTAMLNYFFNELIPSFNRISSLKLFSEQVTANLEKARFVNKLNEMQVKYTFGVLDCLQKNYDEGYKKFIPVLEFGREHMAEMIKIYGSYDLDKLKDNDAEGRRYRFTKMFVETLEGPLEKREELFQSVYGQVCQEMRVWHKLVKPEK